MGYVIHNEFDLEELVYLVTDPEQYRRIVVAFYVDTNDVVKYELRCGTEYSTHFAYEISRKPED